MTINTHTKIASLLKHHAGALEAMPFGLSYLKVLNTRLYELKDYTSDSRYNINFDIRLDFPNK